MKLESTSSSNGQFTSHSQQERKTRKQMVLVAVLGAILLFALFGQSNRESPPPIGLKPSANNVALAGSSAQQIDPADSDDRFESIDTLPRIDLDLILSANLFEKKVQDIEASQLEPATEADAGSEPTQPDVSVGAIYGSFLGTDHRALIGEQIIGSGEQLPTGHQVIEISPEGIQIAR